MSTLLVTIVFGWPAVIISLLLSAIGLMQKKPILITFGGLVLIPFAWFLSGYPAVSTPAILLPLFQFASAWAVSKRRLPLAWSLHAPVVMVVAYVAASVLLR